MKLRLLTLLFTSAAIMSINAAEPSVEAYKKTYDAELKKIRDEHTGSLGKLLDAYGKAVESILRVAQDKGELDTLIAAKQEKARFQKEKSVPKASHALLPAAIQNTRQVYGEARDKVENVRKEKTIHLTQKYVAALDRVIRGSTPSSFPRVP